MADNFQSSSKGYGFSAKPKLVADRQRVRNAAGFEDDGGKYQNMMFDRRVVRGNTHSAYVVPSVGDGVRDRPAVQQPTKRRVVPIRVQGKQSVEDQDTYSGSQMTYSPRGGPKRKNVEVFTDDMIDKLTDLPPYHDIETQTEYIIQKPVPDLSMPTYHGIPKETQIYPDENLFDFDYEAEPLLQVLLTRVLENSRMEVLEEEELYAMKTRQDFLLEKKDRELTDVQKLEQEERDATGRNLRRKAAAREVKMTKIKTHEHIVSRVFSLEYLKFVQRDTFSILTNQGLFIDDRESTIHAQFLPWLVDVTCENLHQAQKYEHIIENLICNVENSNLERNAKTVADEMARRKFNASEIARLAVQRSQRRKSKLEFKLKRREDRRLHNLTNKVMDVFINTGLESTDEMALGDVDGCMDVDRKYVGLLGGVLGEICFVLETISDPTFSKHIPDIDLSFDRIVDLLRNIIDNVLKPNWAIEIGVGEGFENKMREYDDSFEMAIFNASYINDQKDSESKQDVLNIFKYYLGSDLLKKCFLQREPLVVKKLQKMKADGDADEADVEKTGETGNLPTVHGDDGVENEAGAEEGVGRPRFGNLVMDAMLDLFANDDGYSRRFNFMKVPRDNEMDQGFQAFCKMMPDLTPPPEADLDETPAEQEGDGDEDPEATKVVEVEQMPYIPPENARNQEFDLKTLTVANRHEEINCCFYHLHFGLWFRTQIMTQLGTVGVRMDAEQIGDILDCMETNEDQVISKYVDAFTYMKPDILFINSY